MAAFLHFEFSRKLKWSHLSSSGDNKYALVSGGLSEATIRAILGIAAKRIACLIQKSGHTSP